MGELNHNIFLEDLRMHSIKTWKRGPSFFKFQSMPILAIRSNRWQETVSKPKYSVKKQNWIIIFGIQLMRSQVIAFKR